MNPERFQRWRGALRPESSRRAVGKAEAAERQGVSYTSYKRTGEHCSHFRRPKTG